MPRNNIQEIMKMFRKTYEAVNDKRNLAEKILLRNISII